jgi:hypothetical protein
MTTAAATAATRMTPSINSGQRDSFMIPSRVDGCAHITTPEFEFQDRIRAV